MNYKTIAILQALLVVVMLAASLGLAAMFHDIGKGSKELEILNKCTSGQLITISGLGFHCGAVSKEINIKAAQYRGVKNCVKLINGWEHE
tara:strand:- start:1151 stop:1420 length:270 start_codon:yes stop_codon:yes gene_type:complete